MGALVYTGIMSLDGYVVDSTGNFDWSAPDPEVHAFVNELERPVGTYLLGRRMYEVLSVWDTMDTTDEPPEIAEYAAIWRAARKIVYSSTLESVSTERTRIEREFDVEAVRALMRESAAPISIGGPTLAAHAVRAGLVDRFQLFLNPIVVGGGTAFLPRDARVHLELKGERIFGNGVVYLDYRATPAASQDG